MEILLIGKDSPHRRFMINKLLDAGYNLTTCIFSSAIVKSRFDIDSPWAEAEENELVDLYLKETRGDLDRLESVIYSDSVNLDDPAINCAISKADFVIVSGADWIKGDVLDAIGEKSMNVHMGIAEEYRGLDSNLWAWYHGDYQNIGVSLHKLNHTLDTGDLFQVEYINIDDDIKVWELRFYEASLAVTLIVKSLDEIMSKSHILKKQMKLGRYYSFMPAVIKRCLYLSPRLGRN